MAEVPGGLPARSMDEHIMGKPNYDNYSSIPIEYNLEGVLSYDIEVGKSVVVGRTKRNGVEVAGSTAYDQSVNDFNWEEEYF